MRIFLDANILFSAARADGALRSLLTLLELAGHELWADAYVWEEARRNLAAKAPAGLSALDALGERIMIGGMSAEAFLTPELAILPEKDRPVLAAAIRHQCQVLVTGDRSHFGALYGKTVQGVSILSPAMLAEMVVG